MTEAHARAESRSLDGRDFTKAPPAELDVDSVRRNRERTRRFLATGELTWPRGNDWIRLRDWVGV